MGGLIWSPPDENHASSFATYLLVLSQQMSQNGLDLFTKVRFRLLAVDNGMRTAGMRTSINLLPRLVEWNTFFEQEDKKRHLLIYQCTS